MHFVLARVYRCLIEEKESGSYKSSWCLRESAIKNSWGSFSICWCVWVDFVMWHNAKLFLFSETSPTRFEKHESFPIKTRPLKSFSCCRWLSQIFQLVNIRPKELKATHRHVFFCSSRALMKFYKQNMKKKHSKCVKSKRRVKLTNNFSSHKVN